ncbi:16989_t:CDS:2, partial [Cetraspora pellucida]
SGFLGDTTSEFISIRSTISPGISATAYVEVERLLSLLENKKDAVNHILDLVQVYAVGPDFQQDYSMPCITCWSAECLNSEIIKKLSNLFMDEFEVVNKVVFMNRDVNGGNSVHDGEFNSNGPTDSSSSSEKNENGDDEKENNGVNDGENGGEYNDNDGGDENGNDDENSDGDENGGDDENGGGDENDDENSGGGDEYCGNDENDDEGITITSTATAAKVTTANNKSYSNILEFYANVHDCRTGRMLSENWKSLYELGFGYFLDSVEIKISPIPHDDENMFPMIVPKDDYKQPYKLNQAVEILSDHRTSKGVEGQINGAGVQMKGSYVVNNANSVKKMTHEWEVERDGCSTTGARWLYKPVGNFYKRDIVPGIHSGQWYTLDAMRGFSITITQILRCEFCGCGWSKINKKSKLIKLCPQMAHVLEISFNSIDDFNENFAKLNKDYFIHEGLIASLGAKDLDSIKNT